MKSGHSFFFGLACLLMVASTHSLAAQTGAPRNEAPPRSSPRPSSVVGLSHGPISLNGSWKFLPTLPENPALLSPETAAGWKEIAVPGEWAMQGFCVATNQFACYLREFTLPKEWLDQRIKLRFDAVHSECKVWLNGSLVGQSEGCFLPIELDVTKAALAGKNTLVVAVKNESLADRLASATAYAGHPLGGISRKVTLFALPQVNLAAQAVTTRFDDSYRNALLIVHLETANESGADANAQASFELFGPDGAPVAINPASSTVCLPVSAGSQKLAPGQIRGQDIAIPITAPAPWDTEHPNLYTLRTQLKSGGYNTEIVDQRIGFRQIEVRQNQVFVNGYPIKLHGVCRHETHPLTGRTLAAELWRKDAELFRAANVNYIRTSHYPPPEEFLDICDELGLFVECEAPLCWANDVSSDEAARSVLQANLRNVVENRNHPSIILWSLANESAWSPAFAEVLRQVKQLDPSRPTSFHDQSWGTPAADGSRADIANFHYPDTNGPARCDGGARPVLFGEYCHLQTYNQREVFTDPGVRDQWGARFAQMYELMYQHEGNLGGALWSGIDDVFHLPDGSVEGYGYWGVIDGWRRAKPETFHVKKVYSPVRVTTREVPAGESVLTIEVENRYNFASLSEVGIAWALGENQGAARADVHPRRRGEFTIEVPAKTRAGQALRLKFTDPRGFVCEEVELPVKGTSRAALAVKPLKSAALTLATNQQTYTVRNSRFSCEIDRQSGQLRRVATGRHPVLVGGPVLMALPLEGGPCKPQDMTQFGVYNSACQGWTAKSVSAAKELDGSVTVRVEGDYSDFSGHWSLRIAPDGELTLDYDFAANKEFNPRQVGLVLYAARDCDQLSWERQTPWTAYPADHIGRPEGIAKANPNEVAHAIHLSEMPRQEWSADSTALGTADFRSTKEHVLAASLRASQGRGLAVTSDGSQSVRAFVDGPKIGWLIAGINAGGGDPFFSPHFNADRHPLKPGDHVKDTLHLRLVTR